MFFKLALESLLDRKGSFFLSFIAMTVSIFVLLSVEHIRNQTKESFSSALSGVDLIVGAKTGDINLLLYTVFRIGRPTSNVSWQSFEVFKNNPNVNWAIPISLGDSHKGFPVLGTNKDYFKYYSYGEKRKLVFKKGKKFLRLFDVVLGSEVAQRLNYQIGDKLVIAHGLSEVSFMVHDGMPFKIVGILESTGTPVDRTLHVKLEAMEAIHGGSKIKLENLEEPQHEKFIQAEHLYPKNITSFMVGLKSKITTFQLQRDINNYAKEPLLAVLPGVALSELWRIMSVVESSLFLISVLIFISASLGVSAILLSSIRERTKEIKLLRVVGAPSFFIFCLLELEASIVTVASIISASCMLIFSSYFFQRFLVNELGLNLGKVILSELNIMIFIFILLTTMFLTLIPSIYAFVLSRNY